MVVFYPLDVKARAVALHSDETGQIHYSGAFPARMEVSLLGYESVKDTVFQAGAKQIVLKPIHFRLSNVVVTGQAAPVRVDRSVYKVNLIDMKQQQGRAATDLFQMLANESSLRLSTDQQLGGKILMQGLSGQYVKVLVDGVPLTGRLDGNIDLTQINLENVDHIEIVEGPLSVIYGSGALAGTINIITKSKKQEGTDATWNGYGESVGTVSSDVLVQVRRERHLFGASASGYYFGGWDNVDSTVRALKWKPKLKYSGGLQYAYQHKEMMVKAQSSFFDEKLMAKGEPIDRFKEEAIDNDFFTRRWDSRLEGTHSIDGKYKVAVMVAYNYYRRMSRETYRNFRLGTEKLNGTDTSRFDQISSRLLLSSDFGKLNYTLGYDLLWEHGFGERIAGNGKEMGDYAAFATLTFQPWEKLTFQPGIRYVHNTRYEAPLIYSFNMLANPFANWQTRLSFARGFRAPSLKELFLDFRDSNHDVTGNPDLKAETSYNYNASIQYSMQRNRAVYEWGVRAFFNDLDQMIDLVPVAAINGPYTYVNIGKYQTVGYGLDFKFRNYPAYSWSAGVTRTGHYNPYRAESNYSQRFTWSTDVSATFNYHWNRPALDWSLYYRYTGNLPRFVKNDTEIIQYIQQDFHTLDLSVSRAFWRKQLTVLAGVKNVLDVTDVSQTQTASGVGVHTGGTGSIAVGYGRTYFIKLTLNFLNL